MKHIVARMRAPVLVGVAVACLMAGGVYAHVARPDTATPVAVSEPRKAKPSAAAAEQTAAPSTPVDASEQPATPAAAPPQPAAPKSRPPVAAAAPVSRPLSAITIIEGDQAIVRFKSTGKSSTGYLLVWSRISEPVPSAPASGTISSVHLLMQTDKANDVWLGSALAFELKFSPGTHMLRVCENIGGSCGMMSNPIYMTTTSITQCTPDEYVPSQQICLATGSTMSYRF